MKTKPAILNYRLSATAELPLDRTFATGFPGCEDRLEIQVGRNWVPDGHAQWMWEQIQERANEPLLIFVDGDVVFHKSVLDIEMPENASLMGMRESGHANPVTKMWHVSRLHTCLLWVRPQRLLDLTKKLNARFEGMPVRRVNPFEQTIVPPSEGGGWTLFFDTGALAYHWFPTETVLLLGEKLDRFTHLHCGEWAEVAERNGLPGLRAAHRGVLDGTLPAADWRKQCREFYQERANA